MKKMNKKGFTIVELVIVIAVIAILAAVLIPTFSNVVEKANQSAALESVRNAYTQCELALSSAGLSLDKNAYFSDKSGTYFYRVSNNTIEKLTDKEVEKLKASTGADKLNTTKYTTLQNGVKLYGVQVEKYFDETNTSNDETILFAIKGATSFDLTVYDAEGNWYYKESATTNGLNTGVYFSLWNTSGTAGKTDVTWNSNQDGVSEAAKNCMNAEDAEGWYSYTLSYKTSEGDHSFTGVFYYDGVAE